MSTDANLKGLLLLIAVGESLYVFWNLLSMYGASTIDEINNLCTKSIISIFMSMIICLVCVDVATIVEIRRMTHTEEEITPLRPAVIASVAA